MNYEDEYQRELREECEVGLTECRYGMCPKKASVVMLMDNLMAGKATGAITRREFDAAFGLLKRAAINLAAEEMLGPDDPDGGEMPDHDTDRRTNDDSEHPVLASIQPCSPAA